MYRMEAGLNAVKPELQLTRMIDQIPQEDDDEDARLTLDQSDEFISLKEAVKIVPTFYGDARKVRDFTRSCEFAARRIKPTQVKLLLAEVLYTKLRGRALMRFETKKITNFRQFIKAIEEAYLQKEGVVHLQIDFLKLKQRAGESAQAFGARADRLTTDLYDALSDDAAYSHEQKLGIWNALQKQVLVVYQNRLHRHLQMIIRSRNYTTLSEAVAGATIEERQQGTPARVYSEHEKTYPPVNSWSNINCQKCGKRGHTGRECKNSRHANRFSLPQADANEKVNATSKYCTHCNINGHIREDCWKIHGRPTTSRNPTRATREASNNRRKREVNTTTRAYAQDADSSDEERHSTTWATQTVRKHQVSQMMTQEKARGLKFITLPVNEAKQKKITFLLDSGATITIIKVGKLKGNTPLNEHKLTLTGVTGHKAITLGRIKATINLGRTEIIHKAHIVKDNFPVDYEGILGMDFLEKQGAVCDLKRSTLTMGNAVFKLMPYEQILLPPRSETICRAITDTDHIGII
ncbi:uncharacterized protein [Cardiocondyla obscurior]|uniref:uncharacterized protein n=1 Tax=Cardiocondyla obscurior TaxID=286306 RepID=UPI0039655CF9